MKIKVISYGETEFDADRELVEAPLRRAIDAVNADEAADDYVASAVMDCTDTIRDTDDDEHVTITEDDGTVLWSGWLDGSSRPVPGADGAQTAMRAHSGRDWALHPDLWIHDDQQWMRVNGNHAPVTTLRRVGWLDQKGRVWTEMPSTGTFDGGSLRALFIDAREGGH